MIYLYLFVKVVNMTQEIDIAKPRTSLVIGGSRVKNRTLKGVAQTLAQMGVNPTKEIARLAVLAEMKGDLVTASTNWRFLQEYVDAKRKAIDPAENALKQTQQATIEELGKMRRLIMMGTIEAEQEAQTIEAEQQATRSPAHDFI